MVFRQAFEPQTSTYSYLLGDLASGECLLIDPVHEMVGRDLQLISELGLKLKFTLETHLHADHITGAAELKKLTGCRTAISHLANLPCADLNLNEGDQVPFGEYALSVIATPGHTDTCLSFLYADMVFTGDALMIRSAGRTDFQSGSSQVLYNSIKKKLYSLPPETKVFPGHNYLGQLHSTIGEELAFNPRINHRTSEADFVKTMSELKLAPPKKIAEALKFNRQCGQL